MPSGETLTTSLTDSLPTVISSARIVREYTGVMVNVVDRVRLGEGIGLSWNEVDMAQLTASAVSESTKLDNPQEMSDTLLTITPSVVGIHTFITDRVGARISSNAFAKLGSLGQNAIQRKKDDDGLTMLDGATTSLGGAGTSGTSGHILAAVSRIYSNATEPAMGPAHVVAHGFQLKDIQDEIVSGVGTYPIPSGVTAEVFRNGSRMLGTIGAAAVHEDGNITIDSSADAKGGIFAQEAIVLVEGRAPWVETRREPDKGGGGTSVWLYDEYAYGERSSGNWLYEWYTDATAPTS